MLLLEVKAVCDRCGAKIIFEAPVHRLMSSKPPAPEGWQWLFNEAVEGGFWPLACPDCADPASSKWERLDRSPV